MSSLRLTDLEPQFLRIEIHTDTWSRAVGDLETWRERGCPSEEVTGPRQHHVFVDGLAGAQGILFLCPKCFAANGGARGTHSIICWFSDRGVPDEATPKPGRWAVGGTSLADLTFSPSVLLLDDGCGWHGWIQQGLVTSC